MFEKSVPLYRQIIREAWKIAWHKKVMWIFGLFSALIATGGALEIFSRNLNWVFTPHLPIFWVKSNMIWNVDYSFWPMLIMLILLILGLVAFLVFMSVRSFVALITATDKYKTDEKVDLNKVWRSGEKNFGSVLGEVVLFKVIIVGAGFLSTLPLWFIWTGNNWQGWVWLYPLIFVLGMVVAVVASFLMVFTAAYLTLKRYSFGKSLKMAWKLFLSNWLVSLEMALMIFLINMLFGLIYVVATVIVALPTFLFVVLGAFIVLPILSNIAIVIGSLICLVMLMWTAGFVGSFHTIAWSLLFKRMEEGTAVSKLHRLVNQLKRN